eukprot:CAMPEP_0183382416 /NCGR_PEP_ID=MMETSP0164_2-20130417/126937_1 /TAXON_ID=221442 /ORGANISM="Coccolithus pelagicus ssp braarudi, Strain PLY182g" /LENGTH=69 /DNA_ID=CAMNT_0025560037 /DNA_START=174 /DNA_END=383 /DNA_ORIENTATION=-
MSRMSNNHLEKLKQDKKLYEDELKTLEEALGKEEASKLIIEYIQKTEEPLVGADNPWTQNTSPACCTVS